jgi:hypothetical protein
MGTLLILQPSPAGNKRLQSFQGSAKVQCRAYS